MIVFILVFFNLVLSTFTWGKVFWEGCPLLIVFALPVGVLVAAATQNFLTRKVVRIIGRGFCGDPLYLNCIHTRRVLYFAP